MVSRQLNFDRHTAILLELIAVLLVWIYCAVPLAAQSFGRTRVPAGTIFSDPVGSAVPVASSQPVDGVPETADALIEQMSAAAGVIFAGQVTAVRRPTGIAGSGQDAAEGIVEIDLRVDQSLRGPAAGSIYTMREWAGLWVGGFERYKVGQRLLLFLYAPDGHRLSAPVHGAEGAIPLRGSGVAPGPDDASTSAAEWLVDLRWLQAQALRKRLVAALPVRKPGSPIAGTISEETLGLPTGSNFGAVASGRSGRLSAAAYDPALVQAIREPWALPAPAAIETQPLSQVLALCQEALKAQALSSDAMRRRDGSR